MEGRTNPIERSYTRMQISGSVSELRTIIDRAWAMNATALYFVFPNHVVALPDSGEYSYFRTTVFFSHSTILSRDDMLNIRRFLKRIWRSRQQDSTSIFHRMLFDTMTIRDDSIEFDRNPEFTFDMKTTFEPVEQASDLIEKIEQIGVTSLNTNRPYLKLTPKLLNEWYKQLGKTIRQKTYDINHNWSMNRLYMEDGALVMQRDDKEQTKFHYEDGFTVMQDHSQAIFFMYDLDIIGIRRLSREMNVETVVIIPFKNFYLIEGHGESLIYKCHMRLRS
jgi:hypothetical protein